MTGARRGRGTRWSRAVPWLRSVGVVAVGAALVAGAARVPVVDLGERWAAAEGVAPTGTSTQPVTELALTCPGPEQAGLQDATVPEQPQTVRVRALAPPQDVLPEEVSAGGRGHLELALVPGGPPPASTTDRGDLLVHAVTTAQGAVLAADGGLAPGLTAGQWQVSRSEQRRGMASAPCLPASTDAWLVAGGGEPGRLERLVLVNPGADPVTVRADVHGTEGRLPAPGGQGIVVPGRDRVVLLLDALAPGEPAPVVHVTSTGGPVVAALGDRWLEGTLDRGMELSTPVAPPSTSLVVPAVPVPDEPEAGHATLRVAVPGDVQAIVQVRALTADGPARVENDVTVVRGGAVADIDLSGVPAGTHGLEVTSDEPVVAALQVERRPAEEGPSDMAWVPASGAVTGLAGAPLPQHPEVDDASYVSLASTEGARAEVITLDAAGELSTAEVEVPAAGAVRRDVSGRAAVWVRPVQGELHAALVATDPGSAGGPLIAGYPLQDLAVSNTVLPVRPWRP